MPRFLSQTLDLGVFLSEVGRIDTGSLIRFVHEVVRTRVELQRDISRRVNRLFFDELVSLQQ